MDKPAVVREEPQHGCSFVMLYGEYIHAEDCFQCEYRRRMRALLRRQITPSRAVGGALPNRR